MLNLCIFIFIFYALFAIVRMLIDYTQGTTKDKKAPRRRNTYEENGAGIGIAETSGADKAYY